MTEKIRRDLFELKDEKYRDFHSKLMPGIDKEKIIGVRTPLLRKYAVKLCKDGLAKEFIRDIPHKFYEENNLHGIIINKIKDFDECISALDRFLPCVDNWASCDILNPVALKKNPELLLIKIRQWLTSEHTYTVRYGIKCLMDNFLEENFSDEILNTVCRVEHEDYYVRMVQAWFFATALAKQYDSTVVYLQERRLPSWVHNKTIQKAVESYRISDEAKSCLRLLRIK